MTALPLFAALLLGIAMSPAAAEEGTVNRPSRFPRYDRTLVLDAAAARSANVSLGDVNGDSQLDLLLVNGRHWPGVSRIFLGDGHGHFKPAYDLSGAGYRSYSGRLADVDGDGDLDVVLSNDTPDPKVVKLNDGKGRFRAGPSYGRPEWETRNVSLADLNGDGRPDIVVANRSDHPANYICLNDGKGGFPADCTLFSRESATSISLADVNDDGRVDLIVPNRDGGQSYVYLGSTKGDLATLARVPFGPPDASFRMAEAADLDGDGLPDIAAIDERRGVAVYFGQKGGTFSLGTTVAGGKVTPYALAIGDLNGDRRIDLVVGHVEAPSTVYFNDGTGRHYIPVSFGDNKGTVYGFAIADPNGDGFPDIAVARSDAVSVVYFGGPSH